MSADSGTDNGNAGTAARHGRWRVAHAGWFARSLSAKVLLLTAFFVMLVEVLVFVPSIARFRSEYLQDRLGVARIAVMAMLTAPDFEIADDLADQLLQEADLHFIVVREAEDRKIMLARAMPPEVDLTYDLRDSGIVTNTIDALTALVQTNDHIIRVLGLAERPMYADLEIVLDERPMIEAMQAFALRIFILASFIALVTAVLLYIALRWVIVRPMQRLTRSMTEFRDDPFDATRTLRPDDRLDEIGRAIAEFADMQHQVRTALHQQTRLAQLGEAVAKFNHDLRNILANALLIADRLAMLPDMRARELSQPLIDTIDKAVKLCRQTLVFASEGRVPLKPSRFPLAALVDETAAHLNAARPALWRLDNRVPSRLSITADREAMERVIGNLFRNAIEAGARTLTVTAADGRKRLWMAIADNGPGIPDKIRETLFQPFTTSTKTDGTGLGLANARELMRAHGGDLRLLDTGPDGTRFELDLPVR